jgi:hypothetical protein
MCQAEEMRPHPKITTLKVYSLLCSECHGLYTKEPTSSSDGKADHLKQHVDSAAHSQVGVSVETARDIAGVPHRAMRTAASLTSAART